jgi:4-amino-4-deoxy-L-arabinose transferase-like glycosyltransferase
VNSSRPLRGLTIVLILGLGLRAILWWSWNGQPIQIDDAKDYHQLAVGLVETGSFVNASGDLVSLRPPLYPWIVSIVYRIFGVENDAAVRAFQALVSLLTVWLVYRLGASIYSESIGLVAAAITCCYPTLLGFNNLILSESLFAFLCVGSTLLLVHALQKHSVLLLVMAGAVLGLAALTRSVAMLSIPFLALLVLTTWRGRWATRISSAILFVLTFSLVIGPWAYRNTRVQKAFTLIDVMGGRNAMMGNYEYTPLERSWATITDVTGEKAWDYVLRQKHPETKGMTQGQLDKVALKHGLHFALTHPFLTAQRMMVRFFNFWQLERTLVAGAQQGLWGNVSKAKLILLAGVICGSYAIAMGMAIFGVILVPPDDRRILVLLIICIAVPCLVHTAIFAHERYRLPLMPLIVLFSAAAWTQRQEIWKRRGEWRFKLATASCIVLGLAWAREIIFADLARSSQVLP